jgi:hypothetical protein
MKGKTDIDSQKRPILYIKVRDKIGKIMVERR